MLFASFFLGVIVSPFGRQVNLQETMACLVSILGVKIWNPTSLSSRLWLRRPFGGRINISNPRYGAGITVEFSWSQDFSVNAPQRSGGNGRLLQRIAGGIPSHTARGSRKHRQDFQAARDASIFDAPAGKLQCRWGLQRCTCPFRLTFPNHSGGLALHQENERSFQPPL
jgi:hypothetical protein